MLGSKTPSEKRRPDITQFANYGPFIVACEQALLFGQAKRASRERASEGPRFPLPLAGFAARSRVLARLVSLAQNRRACSQATFIVSVEFLRFQDENDYEYEIFSILSSARP